MATFPLYRRLMAYTEEGLTNAKFFVVQGKRTTEDKYPRKERKGM